MGNSNCLGKKKNKQIIRKTDILPKIKDINNEKKEEIQFKYEKKNDIKITKNLENNIKIVKEDTEEEQKTQENNDNSNKKNKKFGDIFENYISPSEIRNVETYNNGHKPKIEIIKAFKNNNIQIFSSKFPEYNFNENNYKQQQKFNISPSKLSLFLYITLYFFIFIF